MRTLLLTVFSFAAVALAEEPKATGTTANGGEKALIIQNGKGAQGGDQALIIQNGSRHEEGAPHREREEQEAEGEVTSGRG